MELILWKIGAFRVKWVRSVERFDTPVSCLSYWFEHYEDNSYFLFSYCKYFGLYIPKFVVYVWQILANQALFNTKETQ